MENYLENNIVNKAKFKNEIALTILIKKLVIDPNKYKVMKNGK